MLDAKAKLLKMLVAIGVLWTFPLQEISVKSGEHVFFNILYMLLVCIVSFHIYQNINNKLSVTKV